MTVLSRKLIFIGLIFFYGYALAQGPISTERPTQSIGSLVLPPNSFQVEQGFTYRDDTLVLDGLFRMAVSTLGEVRVMTFYDTPKIIWGAKVNLLAKNEFRPGLAIKVDMAEGFALTDYRISFDQKISQKTDLVVNLGSADRFYWALAFGYGLTRKFSTYLEAYWEKDYQQYNTGLTYQITSEWQVDFNTGWLDYKTGYLGFGVAKRISFQQQKG